MNCDRFQRLLHLNRPGELSAADADDLRRHLSGCPACLRDFKNIDHADRLVARARLFSPEPVYPDVLTAAVLRRVKTELSRDQSGSRFNRFLDFFLLPIARYGAVAMILAIVAILTAQSVSVLAKVAHVEAQAALPVTQKGLTTYSARSQTLSSLASREELKPLATNLPIRVFNGRIEASARGLSGFLSPATLKNLTTLVGSSAFRLDPKQVETIVHEVRATAGRTFRSR